MDAVALFQDSLTKLSEIHTANTLGDRSNYLGASDIGHCPRKVILQKIKPRKHDLRSLLFFKRGHMAEEIVAEVFAAAGFKFDRQEEAKIDVEGVPFIAHIDFVFSSERAKVKSILEVKSSEAVEPFGSWEMQLYVQMGGLQDKYPDYTIRGAILIIDLADGTVRFFNGYSPNASMYCGLKVRAQDIWSTYQAALREDDVALETEVGLLCGHCNYLLKCPAFAGEEVPDLIGFVEDLENLKGQAKDLKTQIDMRKRHLLEVVETMGNIQVENYILHKKITKRSSYNFKALGEFLEEYGATLEEFKDEPSISMSLHVKRQKINSK